MFTADLWFVCLQAWSKLPMCWKKRFRTRGRATAMLHNPVSQIFLTILESWYLHISHCLRKSTEHDPYMLPAFCALCTLLQVDLLRVNLDPVELAVWHFLVARATSALHLFQQSGSEMRELQCSKSWLSSNHVHSFAAVVDVIFALLGPRRLHRQWLPIMRLWHGMKGWVPLQPKQWLWPYVP